MKRIAALGMVAITIAANLNPMTADAAGVRSYSQCVGGTNSAIISSNCSLEDLQSKLADMGINSNGANLSQSVTSQNCPLSAVQGNSPTYSSPATSKNCAINGNATTQVPEKSESAVEASQQILDTVNNEIANTKAENTTNCTTANCTTTNCDANCTTSNCETGNCDTDNCTTTNCNTSCTTPNTTGTTNPAANTTTDTATTSNETTTANVNTANTNAVNTNTANTNTANTNTTNTTTANTTTVNTNTQASNTESSYAQQVVNLVNVERAKEGLSALTIDQNVAKAAMVRANEIQTKFAHVRPDGSGFVTALKEYGVTYRGAGENIAWGQKTPEEVVSAWMNSPGHRANIMNKNYVHIGVGNVQNSEGTQYWAQIFTY